jgi:subtilase family serine protease
MRRALSRYVSGLFASNKEFAMKDKSICRQARKFILALSLVSAAAWVQAASAPPLSAWITTNGPIFGAASTSAAAASTAGAVGAQLQGTAAASQPVSIVVMLKLNNKSTLDSYIAAQHTPGNPAYRQWLTSAQVAQNFMPTAAQQAFNTQIGGYSRNGQSGQGNITAIQVPAALSQVDPMLGLDSVIKAHTLISNSTAQEI